MEENKLLEILVKYNPWWTTKKIPDAQKIEFKRRFFHHLKKEFKDEKVCAIIGPRRVGKTVLLYQLIEDLLNKGVNDLNILYISLDNDLLLSSNTSINEILSVYYKFILKETMGLNKNKIFVFFDEVQAENKWHVEIKNFWDMKYNIKFFVSGSSSLLISESMKKSLHGRVNTHLILPFKFSEVLEYNKVFDGKMNFLGVQMALRSIFKEAISKGQGVLFNAIQNVLGELIPYKDKIEILLNRYLIVGGYPEFLNESNYSVISSEIKEKLKFTFYEDIILPFKLRNPAALNSLFSIISASSSNEINYSKTAKLLSLQRPTLKSYISYLEAIYLVSELEFFSRSPKERETNPKKIYINDCGIRNEVLGSLNEGLITNPAELGKVVEGFVMDHLKRMKFINEMNDQLFYWRNKNGEEVDFIFEYKGKEIPIEVKFRADISEDYLKGILSFMEEEKPSFGLVITKDKLESDQKNKLLFVPLWLFSIMV